MQWYKIKLNNNSIEAEIITGINKGKRILPRIQLTPSVVDLPFTFCRRQFPVRLAYSTTINKSQGQTFDKAGSRPCFTHGQLYVAFSRAQDFQGVKIQHQSKAHIMDKHTHQMLYLNKLLICN